MRAVAIRAVLSQPPPFMEPLEAPVMRTIAIRDDQTLEQLHEALRLGFGWADQHLYSFWIGGKHWDEEVPGYTAPFDESEEGQLTANVQIRDLGLRKGTKIAYLFDFGDEWRLDLEVVDSWRGDEGSYPMLVEGEGTPPPQYPPLEEDEIEA